MAKRKLKEVDIIGNQNYNRLQNAKVVTKIGSASPTIDTFSNIHNSNDLQSREDSKELQEPLIRPSKKTFNIDDYLKEIVIVIIIAIGTTIITLFLDTNSIKKDIDQILKSVEKIEKNQEESSKETNEIKSTLKLQEYKINEVKNNSDNKDKTKKD